MTLRLTSLPAESVDLALIKTHARIDGTDEDALLNADIAAAVEQVERAARVGFAGGTWEWTADAFPLAEIEIGFGPVTSVEAINYLDADGSDQVMLADLYRADTVSQAGRIFAVDGWPAALARENAVRVRFLAGDGNIPAPINRAIRMMMAEGYDDRARGGGLTGPAQQMVAMYRRPWF